MRGGAGRVRRAADRGGDAGRWVLRSIRRHWPLLVLLAGGAAVRALAVYAYRPAFSFPDSISYLQVAETGVPQPMRTWAYSGFLALLDGVVPFAGVAVVQHLLGLLSVVLVHALLQHRGVRRWIRVLAVAPLALDGYLIALEHYVMAESLYVFLLVSGLVLLLWHERPPWWAATGAGVLLAAGALTRAVGEAVLILVALYVAVRLLRRTVGWLSAGAAAVGVVAVLLPYVLWFHGTTGVYALTDFTGHFLYGRVSSFADCAQLEVPTRLRPLCPTGPPAKRADPDWYVWSANSPANSGRFSEQDLTDFDELVIRGQPLAYLAGTAAKTLHYFLPGRYAGRFDYCTGWWNFPGPRRYRPHTCHARLATRGFGLEPTPHHMQDGSARLLVGYQDWVHTPGPVLGALALVGLSGLVPHRRRGTGRDAMDGVFCVAIGLALAAAPSATTLFDYRYGLPLLAVMPMGAALACRGWTGGRPRRPAGSGAADPALFRGPGQQP